LPTSLQYLTNLFQFKKKEKNTSWETRLHVIYSQSYYYSTWSFQPQSLKSRLLDIQISALNQNLQLSLPCHR